MEAIANIVVVIFGLASVAFASIWGMRLAWHARDYRSAAIALIVCWGAAAMSATLAFSLNAAWRSIVESQKNPSQWNEFSAWLAIAMRLTIFSGSLVFLVARRWYARAYRIDQDVYRSSQSKRGLPNAVD